MNPRGQVAPQTQLRRVPATPPLLFVSGTGGAAGAIWGECQRPRRARSADQDLARCCPGSDEGPKSVHFGVLYSSKIPLFDVFFLENAFKIASRWSKRCLSKRWPRNKKQERNVTEFGGFGAEPGSPFWQLRRRYCSWKPPNQGPETDPPNLLTSQLKGTSGLPRSLALSSSCACGAKIMFFEAKALEIDESHQCKTDIPLRRLDRF